MTISQLQIMEASQQAQQARMNDAAEHILRMEQTLVEKDLIISSLKQKVTRAGELSDSPPLTSNSEATMMFISRSIWQM